MNAAADLGREASLRKMWRALYAASSCVETESEIGGVTNVAQWFDYAPYGSVIATTNTGQTVAARGYIGQFSDQSGLSYLNARYYNASLGQFITHDPVFWGDPKSQDLMDPQDLNSYSYAVDNPINKSDPDGRWYREFIMGQQSWPSFQLELGDAANQLAMQNPTWGYAFDHPYRSGAVVGGLSVVAADSAVSTYAAFNAARFAGVSASYAAKQAIATGYYSTLTLSSLGAIPAGVNTAGQINFNQKGSALSSAFSLSLQIGPTLIGGYTGAISDIFQFLDLLNQGLTNLIRNNNQASNSSKNSSQGSSGTTSNSPGGGGGGGSTPQGSSNNGGWGNAHTACGTLCM